MKKKTIGKLIAIIAVVLVVGFCFIYAKTGAQVNMYATIWALLPPVIAIALALVTKEVYTSLAVGIFVGALFYSNFNLEDTLMNAFFSEGGLVSKLSDPGNIGIIAFLCILGALVNLINKAGGSQAFGRFASKRIKTRLGAQIATVIFGIIIFVDDYFNCLTVGSVMRPITDKHKVSRAKLAYLIDSTAAPICVIAPVSSWAAAITVSLPEDMAVDGFQMFLRTIPYNLYALLAIVLMLTLAIGDFDYGPMAKHEKNARKGDLFTTASRPYGESSHETDLGGTKGKVIDLVVPVLVLIVCCIIAMIYTGGFFEGAGLIQAFGDASASKSLLLGSFVTLLFTFAFYMLRDVMSFKDFMNAFVDGCKNMIPAILILILAWTLSGMTGMLGGAEYVKGIVDSTKTVFQIFLPIVIFLVACGLSFSTGTSWGTFGILIPIVCSVFPAGSEMLVIAIAACLSGSVMGDNCSPISDTTIMSSAGAQCDHVNHVSTQLPYALTVAAVALVGYILAAVIQVWYIVLPICIVLMVGVALVIRMFTKKKYAE